MERRWRRAVLGLIAGGLAIGPGCGKGCSSKDLGRERKVMETIEIKGSMTLEVVSRIEGKHVGACAPGGGKGNIGLLGFDTWKYEIAIEGKRSDGKAVRIDGGGDATLVRVDNPSKAQKDPLADVTIEHCEEAKTRRVVMRVHGGEGDQKDWTVVYPFDRTIGLPQDKVEGATCEDALRKVDPAETWLVNELRKSNKDGVAAFAIAVAEKIHYKEALDYALRVGSPNDAETDALVEAIKKDAGLAAHVLARLAPRPVTPPYGEFGKLSFEKLLDAISDEPTKRDAVKKAIAECQLAQYFAECTTHRLEAMAYWATKKKDSAACEGTLAVARAMTTTAVAHGEARAVEILRRVSTCASERSLRDLLLVTLEPKVAEGDKLTACAIENECEADTGAFDMGDRDRCPSLPALSALWLAEHCDASVAARAKAILAGKPVEMVEKSAKCLAARCKRALQK